MTDKFPEAFERFEKDEGISDIKTFQQLLDKFGDWAKTPEGGMTRPQKRGLAIEGERIGIGSKMQVTGKNNREYWLEYREINYKSGPRMSWVFTSKPD